MELYGAVPHFIVDVTPGDLSSGRDPQLDKAIEVVLEQLKDWEVLPEVPDYPDKSK